ncbi:hypothetical protein [Alkalitalea saponilacus]|uniref:Por secretion system C-terminal sorting domain-containing protein n=1 Tax=Alkalitalea saponilacus TaxID=889453 RepID=A0A1T5CPX9_9BACT|nr:hypothetical protein [Alkalitalea saponilacus]ASB49939.1 hypothetical protein CDL62_12720 [Alkalitalea saponilacus]SKB61383.1 hypothetical protein SAMN03080601_00902 [Alkalitalea saponilacus]
MKQVTLFFRIKLQTDTLNNNDKNMFKRFVLILKNDFVFNTKGMKKIYTKKLGFLLVLSMLAIGESAGQFVSNSIEGNYEDASSWNGNQPPVTGITSQTMTIVSGAVITRTGDFNPARVTINGRFTVNNGNCILAQWGGHVIENGAYVEIFGNLTASQSLNVKEGATLIVHGNVNVTGAGIFINGNMVVKGDFTITNGALSNTGKLIIGGTFKFQGGGFQSPNGNSNLYLLDPDADHEYAYSPIANKYGDIDDFLENESGNEDLLAIAEKVLPDVVNIGGYRFLWVGSIDVNWADTRNWGGSLPDIQSNVRIKPSGNNPEISFYSGVIEVNNLLIENGAVLTLKPGARLTVNGNLIIQDDAELVLENSYEEGGMASLITYGQITGDANVKLTLPKEKWYYLGSAIRDATFGNFSPGAQGSGTLVNVYRDRWYSTFTQHYETAMRKLEGVAVFYHKTSESDHLMELSYMGELNSGEISRTFVENRFQLMANPYPSFINWLDDTGWEREHFESTIWYRTRIGESMTYITFNRSAVPGARVSLFSDSGEYNEEEMSLIPPKQSFYVRPIGSNRTITVNNQARVHGLPESQLKSSNNAYGDVIRITANNGLTRDGAVIYFSRSASEGIDEGDSEKYRNNDERVPEIFTRTGETELAINGLPELNQPVRTIPLIVRNRVPGDVSLTFDMSYYYGMHSVYLEDRDTGAFIHVTAGGEYVYTVSEPGERDDRFVLHFYMVSTDLEPEMEDPSAAASIRINGVAGKVLVSIDSQLLQMGEANIEVFSIEGQKVSETLARSSRTLVVLPRTSAIFIVRVTAGDVVKSERVVGVR